MSKQEKLVFSVVSWGHTATTWLSKILNAHPDVFAVHNLRNSLPTINNMGFRSHWYYDLINRFQFFNKPVSIINTATYYEYLERLAWTYKLVGDVHGVQKPYVPMLRNRFGDRIRIAYLTRHPIPRILSQTVLIQIEKKDGWKNRNTNFKKLIKSFPPDLKSVLDTKDKLFFARSIKDTNLIKGEMKDGPVFKMEAITSDFNEFNRLFSFLSQNTLTMKWEMVESIFDTCVASKNVNKVSNDPGELFNAMEDWQKEAFRTLFDPKAREIYEDLGYDFSFID